MKKVLLYTVLPSTFVGAGVGAFFINSYLENKANNVAKLDSRSVYMNFDNLNLFKPSFDVVRETTRIAINTTDGFADLKSIAIEAGIDLNHSLLFSDVKDQTKVTKEELIDILYKKVNKSNILHFTEILRGLTFYQPYGFKFKKDFDSSEWEEAKKDNGALNQYISKINENYIEKITSHDYDWDYKKNFYEFKDSDNPLFKIRYTNGTSHKYLNVKEFIDLSLNEKINFVENNSIDSKYLIKYKIPKGLLMKYNSSFDQENTYISTTSDIKAIYDPSDRLKMINSLFSISNFVEGHKTDGFSCIPFITPFVNFKFRKTTWATPMSLGNIQKYVDTPGNEYYLYLDDLDRYISGRPISHTFANEDLFRLNEHSLWMEKRYKSHIPLNKKYFLKKLHNSQSGRYGISALFGHNPGNYDQSVKLEDMSTINPRFSNFNKMNIINWQYINRIVSWGNPGFNSPYIGETITIPNSKLTDLAHRNGAMSLGTIFPDPYSIVNLHEMLKKDEEGNYPWIDGAINLAKTLNFDGYMFNLEFTMPWQLYNGETPEVDKNYVMRRIYEFHRTMIKKFKEANLLLDLYGNKIYSNLSQVPIWNEATQSFKHLDQIASPSSQVLWHLPKDENGQVIVDAEHMPGFGSMHPYLNQEKDNFLLHLKDVVIFWQIQKALQKKGYGGIAWQVWEWDREKAYDWWLKSAYDLEQKVINLKDNAAKPSDGVSNTEFWGDIEFFNYSLGIMLGNHMTHWEDEKWQESKRTPFKDDFEYEDMWASGVNTDPRTTGTSAFSRFFQERTIIDGTKSFSTTFKLANNIYIRDSKEEGDDYFYIDGKREIDRRNEINSIAYPNGPSTHAGKKIITENMRIQDVFPSYRFIIDKYNNANVLEDHSSENYANQSIKANFSNKDAWFGNYSLNYKGTLKSGEYFVNKLYASHIESISSSDNFEIISKSDAETKLVIWGENDNKTIVEPSKKETINNGWVKYTFNPSNQKIHAFGIGLKNTNTNVLNLKDSFIGSIAFNKNTTIKPNIQWTNSSSKQFNVLNDISHSKVALDTIFTDYYSDDVTNFIYRKDPINNTWELIDVSREFHLYDVFNKKNIKDGNIEYLICSYDNSGNLISNVTKKIAISKSDYGLYML